MLSPVGVVACVPAVCPPQPLYNAAFRNSGNELGNSVGIGVGTVIALTTVATSFSLGLSSLPLPDQTRPVSTPTDCAVLDGATRQNFADET
jgi:hypothetical protein